MSEGMNITGYTEGETIDAWREKPEALFTIRSLIFCYADGRRALNGIDLDIHAGDRIALVGQNGAGKTTLAKHLNGLYRPQGGRVLYKGEPLEGANLVAARLVIGMLFQDPDDQLFCNTLDEDIAFGPLNQGLDRSEIENRVTITLQEVGLDGLRFKAPHNLSYGQKKRAAFATILAMHPQVLILDEPTAYLDPKQDKFFIEMLRQFHGTLICISHDLFFLYDLCTRAVVLEKGKIHHDFSMKELVSQKAYLREHGLDFTFRLSCCQANGDDAPAHSHHHADPHVRDEMHDHVAGIGEDLCPNALIRLQDFTYRYPDGTWGVRQVNLAVQEGESVAITGENGAGKSTLVSCLCGLIQGEGEYLFGGVPVSGRAKRELWRHCGMVFQDPADQLFCPSCEEEVAFGPRQLRLPVNEVHERVQEALKMVRLEGFEDRIPHHLSAGERKRLALASILSMRPRVLILDEPTANLDPQSEEILCTILGNLDVTRIVISHDMDIIAMTCARTLVMHRGRLIRDYSTRAFTSDGNLISINGLDYTFKNQCCKEIMQLQRTTLPSAPP